MKKSLILLGMLSIGYAYAQEGNVGINTENPKATLEVLPNSANLTKTTNEGIIAPKLTKARIADIADANLVEGTLVYATDNTYTGANTKVSKITEKGYYFYNGTEWVKVQYQDNDTSEWRYDATSKQIVLKRSGADNFANKVYFNEYGGLRSSDRAINGFSPYNALIKNASKLSSSTDALTKYMDYRALIYDENTGASGSKTFFTFGSSAALEKNITLGNEIDYMYSGAFSNNLRGTATVKNIIGINNTLYTAPDITFTNIYGTKTLIENSSAKGANIIGEEKTIRLSEASASNLVAGDVSYIRLENNNGTYGTLTLNHKSLVFTSSSPTIDNYYGYRLVHTIGGGSSLSNVKNAYGIYLPDFNFASEKSYAIYTNRGKVRVGDLADTSATTDRTVVVDKDGVLKVGTATASTPAPAVAIGSTSSMECNASNRGKMNFIQGTDGKSDVFGICMKNADGNYYWGYMVGGNNPTNGTGAFGSGL